MTPAQFRLLRFISHLSIYLGLELQFSSPHASCPPTETLKSLVINGWGQLAKILNNTTKEVCGLLLCMVRKLSTGVEFSVGDPMENSDSRAIWEREFNDSIHSPQFQYLI